MKSEIVNKLNLLLADYQIHYQNLRGFHWNIQGKYFFELHAKFEELYNDAAVKIDEVAERILTIDGTPLHTFEDYVHTAEIEAKKNIHQGETAVESIISDLTAILQLEKEIKVLAVEHGDDGTEDLMSGFMDQQEKTLWMLKAWMK
ncbi:MAG: DNA starvation/stationary phase protection protein [Bacteroidota bacterium]